MAEAAAAIGLIASIASLIDLGAKVTSRLDDFASKTTDVPQSFRSLTQRLPLLVATLRQINQQAQAGRLPNDVTNALQSLVQSTTSQLSILESRLAQVIPPPDTSRVRQAAEALQSLTKDGEILTAVERVQQDIDFLVLHQTTHYVDIGERILEELAKLQLGQTPALTNSVASVYPPVSAHDHARVHLGDVYHVHPPQESASIQAYGLCWGEAPLIDADLFIGRVAELDQMVQVLQPGKSAVEQRRLVLGGLGGMGKTQLAIAYARQQQHHYASVFWLNATSASTLKASVRSVAQQLFPAVWLQSLDDDGTLQAVLQWLSDMKNTSWLLIFDNYDDPELYSIEQYLPNTAHGSIIITTRLPDLIPGQRIRQVRVSSITDLDESLKVLQTRSQRDNVQHNPDARHLVERLAGLPLALATAGAYLLKTTATFSQYLEAYEHRFNVNPRRPTQLQEYRDRTLFTTWDLSYSRLEQDDQLAARTLRLLAYFDNQQVWYELLHSGLEDDSPAWLQEVAAAHMDFESVMGTLVDYGLVEAHPETRSYSMHNCVHDWTLAQLNKSVEERQYWYAVRCTAAHIDNVEWDMLRHLRYGRLAPHASRLVHPRLLPSVALCTVSLKQYSQLLSLANLLARQVQFSAAETMYFQILAGQEEALGPDHIATLQTHNSLGILYANQGRLDKAEQTYTRALAGKEKKLGLDHTSTLQTVNNLGILYADQGKLDKAEQMYQRALAGHEKALGPDHNSTLDTVHNLGLLYAKQGKLDEAEQMYQRALAGCEKTLGHDHIAMLRTLNNLGVLYGDQGKLDEAEQMYQRALAGYEKALGPDHNLTLDTVHNLGVLYTNQGKLCQADEMFSRVLNTYQGSDIKVRWHATIEAFAEALARNIKISKADPDNVKCQLTRLVPYFDPWDCCHSCMYWFARALLWGEDKENACIAFARVNTMVCDSCSLPITSGRGHYVCSQCDDVDLCGKCMADRSARKSTLPACEGHDHYDIASMAPESLQPTGVHVQVDEDVWIRALKTKYISIADS